MPAAAGRERVLAGAAATASLGASLARAGLRRGAVHLAGDLGSGKTTLVRGFLRACGVTGPIRSPTFTMVEEYRAGSLLVAHYDLYRVADPEELDYLGLRDHLAVESLLFVEWPERGGPACFPVRRSRSVSSTSNGNRRREPAIRAASGAPRSGPKATASSTGRWGDRGSCHFTSIRE